MVFFVAVFFWCWGNDGRLLPCLGLWLLRQASLYSAASHLVDSTWDLFVTSRKGWVEKGEGWRDIPSQWEFTMWDDKNLQIVDFQCLRTCNFMTVFLQFSSESIMVCEKRYFQRWSTGELFFRSKNLWPTGLWWKRNSQHKAQFQRMAGEEGLKDYWKFALDLHPWWFGTREIFQFSCDHVMIQTDCVVDKSCCQQLKLLSTGTNHNRWSFQVLRSSLRAACDIGRLLSTVQCSEHVQTFGFFGCQGCSTRTWYAHCATPET